MADFEFLIKLAEGKREVTITYCDYRLCHSNQQSVRDSDGSIPALGNEGNARAETRSAEDKRVKRMRSQGCGCSTLLQGLALVLGVVGQSRRAAARNRLQTPALTITYRAKQAIKHVARAHLVGPVPSVGVVLWANKVLMSLALMPVIAFLIIIGRLAVA